VSAALLARVRLGTAHIAGYSLDGKLLATRMLCTALAQQWGLTLAGDPGADSTLEELVLPDCAGPAAALRALLRQAYAIGEDDRRLRQAILGAGEAQAAANFDALRKHYPVRRELRGRPVSHAADGQRALLLAMGCVPQRRPE
jgi:erythronate-4-phosphate dehydrogenase